MSKCAPGAPPPAAAAAAAAVHVDVGVVVVVVVVRRPAVHDARRLVRHLGQDVEV